MAELKMRCFCLTGFGKPLQRRERAVPEVSGTEILVKVAGAGVCHSDLHLQDGYIDLGQGKKATYDGKITLPVVLGHEIAGTVVAMGPDAQGVSLGANVLATAWIGCGRCDTCLSGNEQDCMKPAFPGLQRDGGFADYVMIPNPRYLFDLGDLNPVEAAPLACSGLTTYAALKKFGPDVKKKPLVIIGAGGLGLMAVGLLKLMGAPAPVILDIDATKRDAALAAGARAAIDPTAGNALDLVRRALEEPVVGVLDLVGSGKTAITAIDLLAKGGKAVIVGIMGGEVTLSVPMIPIRNLTIQGSYAGSLQDMQELVALVRAHGLPKALPVSKKPLEEAGTSLDDLRAGKVVGRVVLVP